MNLLILFVLSIHRRTLKSHTGSIRSVAWHGAAAQIVSTSDDNTVRVWDLGVPAQARTTPAVAAASDEIRLSLKCNFPFSLTDFAELSKSENWVGLAVRLANLLYSAVLTVDPASTQFSSAGVCTGLRAASVAALGAMGPQLQGRQGGFLRPCNALYQDGVPAQTTMPLKPTPATTPTLTPVAAVVPSAFDKLGQAINHSRESHTATLGVAENPPKKDGAGAGAATGAGGAVVRGAVIPCGVNEVNTRQQHKQRYPADSTNSPAGLAGTASSVSKRIVSASYSFAHILAFSQYIYIFAVLLRIPRVRGKST